MDIDKIDEQSLEGIYDNVQEFIEKNQNIEKEAVEETPPQDEVNEEESAAEAPQPLVDADSEASLDDQPAEQEPEEESESEADHDLTVIDNGDIDVVDTEPETQPDSVEGEDVSGYVRTRALRTGHN